MKKLMSIVAIIATLAVSICFVPACSDDGTINVVVVDGAPVLAVAEMINSRPEYDGYDITYEVVNGIDTLQTKLLSGDADIAIAPTNSGAMLYNKYEDLNIKLASTVVHGIIYVVGNDGNVTDLSDLIGEVVYGVGESGTPDLVFKYLLEASGIEYVSSDEAVEGKVAICNLTDGTVPTKLLSGIANFAVLGEPAVTTVVNNSASKDEPFSVLFDLQEMWTDETNTNLPQASLFVTDELSNEEHSDFVEWFLDEVEAGIETLEASDDNLTAAKSAVEAIYEATSILNVDLSILENCNIKSVRAEDVKDDVDTYLGILYDFEPDLIGGAVPDSEFYLI